MLLRDLYVTDQHAPSGGVSACVVNRLQRHVKFVKCAEDGSYLWLKFKCVAQGCPEV